MNILINLIDEINTTNMSINPVHKNRSLNQAFVLKKDEFYTSYEDIVQEMQYYKDYFHDKVVLCNCDNPYESAFFKFFILHFNQLKLSKLICTGYSNPTSSENNKNGYMAVITKTNDSLEEINNNTLPMLFSLDGNFIENLDDADFRSIACVNLLKEADIVVTNPPFSLFREYINLLIQHNKNFIILGNINATTCKDIFPLFRDNKVSYGKTLQTGNCKFFVPNDYPLSASQCGIDEHGRKFIYVKGIRWFTNLNQNNNDYLDLNCHYSPEKYPSYENYNAIEVSKVKDIPKDYYGFMGVPITFLDKANPNQFEIIMLANGNARSNVDCDILKKVGYKKHVNDKGGLGIVKGEIKYARIIIQKKNEIMVLTMLK